MEVWDLYTADRKPSGKTIIRGETVPEGYYNLGVNIWRRNKEGKYLISQRSAIKKSYPLWWEPVGGGVVAGETSLEGALREVWEEVGIKANPEDMHLVFSEIGHWWSGVFQNEIADVYLLEIEDYDASLAVSDEVAQSKWATKDEIKEMIDNKTFIPSYNYFFEKIDTVHLEENL